MNIFEKDIIEEAIYNRIKNRRKAQQIMNDIEYTILKSFVEKSDLPKFKSRTSIEM